MPVAIPLTQFKVKSTMIWNSIWLMVIDLNLNKKWPIESKSELGINNQQLIRAHCTKWCWLIGVKCNSESNHLWDFKIIYKISKSSGPSCSKADLSAFPGLNFNPGFYISFFQSLLEKIYPILFRTSNDQIASKKIWTEFSFQASRPEIKFHANPGLC